MFRQMKINSSSYTDILYMHDFLKQIIFEILYCESLLQYLFDM